MSKIGQIARLEIALVEAIKSIRSHLQRCEDLRDFEMTIEASGRLHEGEVKITYNLGSYYNSAVKGGRLEPVITEFARRHGWQKANAPVCLTFSETVEREDAAE